MCIYAVFGIGVGNLGRGRTVRRPMSEWVEMLNRHLAYGTPPVRIIGFFAHTGNFLADSPSTEVEEVAARFDCLLETDWVIRPIDDVRATLISLVDAPRPEAEEGVRWTLGLAFHGRSGMECRSMLSTRLGAVHKWQN